jgi:WD40 repeat protein
VSGRRWSTSSPKYTRNSQIKLVNDEHRLASAVRKAVFSPKGDAFAVLGKDQLAFFRLNEQPNFDRIYNGNPLSPYQFSTLAFSPDGKYFTIVTKHEIAAFRRGRVICEVYRHDASNLGNQDKPGTRILRLHHEIGAVAFSPDGRYIVCGADKDLYVYDTQTDRISRQMISHSADINAVTFSPDGQTCASSGLDGVRIWKLEEEGEGWKSPTLVLHKYIKNKYLQIVRAVTFSPDGRQLAFGSENATVKIWDASNFDELASIEPQRDHVRSMNFADDNRILVTFIDDFMKYDSIKFWDVTSQQEIPFNSQILGYADHLTSVDLSSDEQLLLCGFKNGRISVFKVEY